MLLEEFFRLYYGPAAEPMRNYWLAMERYYALERPGPNVHARVAAQPHGDRGLARDGRADDEADLARGGHHSNTLSMRFMVSRWVRSRCSGVTEMPPLAVTARSVSVSEESSTW